MTAKDVLQIPHRFFFFWPSIPDPRGRSPINFLGYARIIIFAKNTSRTITRITGKNSRNQDNDDNPIIHRNCRSTVQTAI